MIRVAMKTAVTLSLLFALIGGCTLNKDSEASLWVLHDARGVANLEVYIDGAFAVEVAPGERSVPFGTSLGAHSLTLRSSGSNEALLTQELSALTARASLMVIRGDEQALSLLEVSGELPELDPGEHALEIVDLSGLETTFSVLLSGQDEGDFADCTPLGLTFTCHVITLPLMDGQLTSEPIIVSPGEDLNISTDHIDELVTVDLIEGEVTTVVIRSPSEDQVSLTAFRASL
jgi:hypothetical protein